MDFTTAVITCFARYATFAGRARRAEFWWFALFNAAVMVVLSVIDVGFGGPGRGMMDGGGTSPVGRLYWLAVLLPSLAVAVRRLHDTDRTGWWVLLQVIPLIGPLILLWFFASRGTPGPNRFGPDPLAGTGAGGPDYGASPIPRVPRR